MTGLWRLRSRLIVLFGSAFVLIGTITFYIFDRVATDSLVGNEGVFVQSMSSAVAYSLGENIREREREIALMAQFPVFVNSTDLASQLLRERMEAAKRSYRYYAWIGVADLKGVVSSAAGGLLEGEDVSKRPWFIQGRQSTYLGDVHEAVLLSKKLQNPNAKEPLRFIDFASPVLDEQGRVKGVLAAHAHWSWVDDVITRMLNQKELNHDIDVFIINKKNEILYPFSAVGTSLPNDMPSHRQAIIATWENGRSFLTALAEVKASTYSELGWRVVVRQPMGTVHEPVRQLQHTLLVLALVVFCISIAVIFWIASRLGRPVEAIAKIAHCISNGDENANFELKHSSSEEIALLSESLQDMTSKLISRKHALEESNRDLEHKVIERTTELAELFNLLSRGLPHARP